MKNQFDPTLDAIAGFIKILFPAGNGCAEVLRLLVDYKEPDGTDHSTDLLVNAPQGMTTAQLIEVVRAGLRPGCTLSAIASVDYGRPVYIAPGFLEECITERGLPIPTDIDAAMDACGLQLLTLAEIHQMRGGLTNE